MVTASLTVLIPAHNEADCIAAAIGGAVAQRPDRVVVVSDNSTDGTPEVARAAGAEVFETVGNTARKAGALNQALDRLLHDAQDEDRVLIVDADTVIADRFAEVAEAVLAGGPDIAAVGGVFVGEPPRGCLETCQANEYARYAREVTRTRRTMVLSGTSSYFRVSALRAVVADRGHVYDPTAITEDNELTLKLRTMGYRLASPEECAATTELMPTLADLHRQRHRWFRGAVENLRDYGFTRVTARYWFQQMMLGYGASMMLLLVALTVLNVTLFGFATHWFWLSVTVLFIVERLVTVWSRAGWRGRCVAALLIPELVYSALLYAAFIHALISVARGTRHEWAHVTKEKDHVLTAR